jgi:site-specific recombinase XerD
MVGRRKTATSLPPRLYEYRGKRRLTYYTITAANKYVTLGHDLLAAKRKLLELEEGRSIAGTVCELLDDYIETVQAKVMAGKKSPRTYQDNLNEANNLKKAFGRMQPAALRPVHVWQYLHKARGRAAPVRANREIALLSAAFNFARQAGILDSNPCVGVERNEEIPRDRYVTEKEYAAFLELAVANGEAGQRVALAMELAYLTGKAPSAGA